MAIERLARVPVDAWVREEVVRAADETVDKPDGDRNFGRVLIEGAVRGQRLDLEPAGREARVGHVAISVRQSVPISGTLWHSA